MHIYESIWKELCMVFDIQVTVKACKVLVAERMVNCMKFTEKFPWFSFVNFLLVGEKLFFGCFVPYIRLSCTLKSTQKFPFVFQKRTFYQISRTPLSLSLSLSLSSGTLSRIWVSAGSGWSRSCCWWFLQLSLNTTIHTWHFYDTVNFSYWLAIFTVYKRWNTEEKEFGDFNIAILLCLALSMENLFKWKNPIWSTFIFMSTNLD